MGQAEQQALVKQQQQTGDHKAGSPPPAAPPTAFHRELQETQRTAPPQVRAAEVRQVVQPQQHQQHQQQEQVPQRQQQQQQQQQLRQPGEQNHPVGSTPGIGQPPLGHYPPPGGQGYGFNPNRPPDMSGWGHQDNDNRHRFGFVPIIPFGPPPGEQWGWTNRDQWNRGYDSSFFQQDPNHEHWQPTITQEAQNVSILLNGGDTQGAATTLNNDLWAMRGDLYGQNELLHEVQNEQTGEGAQLYLGQWDPIRGSWDAIEVQSPAPPPGYDADPSFNLRTFE